MGSAPAKGQQSVAQLKDDNRHQSLALGKRHLAEAVDLRPSPIVAKNQESAIIGYIAFMSTASFSSSPKMLRWSTDQKTAQAAAVHPLWLPHIQPATQVDGYETSTRVWNKRVFQPATWTDPLRSDPPVIIQQFKDGRFTQGLALVVSWGGMGRRAKDIYGDESPATIASIEHTLEDCARDIQQSQSIEKSWQALTGGSTKPRWSEVITSKTLHFLCRALGFEQNPPVPLDGEVIRGRVWPVFRYSMPSGQRPDNWEGATFLVYCRYMTAIRTWADRRGWTTTQVEATIWDHFSAP